MNDALIDLCSMNLDLSLIATVQDGANAVKEYLSKVYIPSDSQVIMGFYKKIYASCRMIKSGKRNEVAKITKLVNKLTIGNEDVDEPMVIYSVDPSNSENHLLTVRIPDIPAENDGHQENLAHYLNFAMKMIGVKYENLRIVKDSKVGTECQLPTTINKFMTSMIGACSSSKGYFAGEVYRFATGFEANLYEILGAMRILRINGDEVRRRPNRGKEVLPLTTFEDLREMFNTKSGLSAQNLPAYGVKLVKAVLSFTVKPHMKTIPTTMIYAVKGRNKVATTDGVLAKLGYVPIIPNMNKVKMVLFTSVEVEEDLGSASNKDSKATNSSVDEEAKMAAVDVDAAVAALVEVSTKAKPTPKPKVAKKRVFKVVKYDFEKKKDLEISHPEFRVGTTFVLPLLNQNDLSKANKVLTYGNFTIKDKRALGYFKSKSEIVDAMNTAYATLIAVDDKKSKATAEHYQNARNHLMHLCNKEIYTDASGTKYDGIKEIPLPLRESLSKTLHRDITKKRVYASDDESESEDMQAESSACAGDGKAVEPPGASAKKARAS